MLRKEVSLWLDWASTSSHKWETYRRRRFGRFSRRRATSILRSVRKERATQKIGQSAIGPPGWLEKGPSASLLVRQVSQRILSSLAPSIQTLLKPTVCLPLMRRCTSLNTVHLRIYTVPVRDGEQSSLGYIAPSSRRPYRASFKTLGEWYWDSPAISVVDTNGRVRF